MINQKFLFSILFLLITFSIANGQTKPVVYVTWDDTSNLNQNDSLFLLDPLTLTEITRIPLPGLDPNYIELSADKKTAFITHSFLSPKPTGMTVIDLETRQIKASLFKSGVGGLRVGENGKLYVSVKREQRLVVVNTETFQEERSVPISSGPASISFSPDYKTIYLMAENNSDQNTPNQQLQDYLYVIDNNNFSVKKIIDLGVANSLGGNDCLTTSLDGKYVYITLNKMVKTLDTSSLNIVDTLTLPGTSLLTYTLQINKKGDTLYELDFQSGMFQIININTKKSIFSTILPTFARELKLTSDEKVLYISGNDRLIVFDPQNFKTITDYRYPKSIFGSDLEIVGDFTPGKLPVVSTLSPSSGQIVQKGSTFNITWSTIFDKFAGASHSIDLSTDGGKNFRTSIAADLPGTTQQFLWQVPANQNISQAVIKITSTDNRGQSAIGLSGTFTIGDKPTDSQPPTVTFSSPLGGEKFIVGDPLTISWNSQDNTGVIAQDLFLSTDGGSTFPIALATGLAGSKQAFTLTLNEAMKSDRARLKLTVQDASGNKATAVTGADFRIVAAPDTQPPTITISQPANSIFSAGQPITVQWQSADNVAVVSQTLLISFDNGQSFQQLSTFDGVANSFVINNIDKFATQAMVKITATDAASNKGEKVANFQIAPALNQASFTKPSLTISGVGFNSAVNNQPGPVRIFINNQEISPEAMITVNSNLSITVKGNKKKLGLVKGNNSLMLMVNGLNSNAITFVF